MPLWLILLGGGTLFAYLWSKGQAGSSLSVGQTAYIATATNLMVNGQPVPIAIGTRVYVETADASGTTQVRTDSGNYGNVLTSSLSRTLPPGVTMQVS